MKLFVFASLVALVGCQVTPPPEQFVNADGYNEITTQEIDLQWKVVSDSLEIILSAPTTGWVAVGFDPTTMMKDANFILAKVENGVAVAEDDFGTQITAHASDVSLGGQDNVSALSGTESGGTTKMMFTIPLDSGDQFDRALAPGQVYTVLLAYATTENFTLQHTARAKVSVTL